MNHWRTILPRLRHAVRPRPVELGERWSTEVPDRRFGVVRIGGWWRRAAAERGAVVLVHGLGGSAGSHYMGPAVAAVAAAGWSSLVLELRGADGRGEDFYHAGLVTDIAAAVASSELAPCERLALVGFSLGGHVALRYATLEPDPRLGAVAALCSPLDLSAAQRAIDAPSAWVYRQYLLANMKRQYRVVAARRDLPLREPLAARTLRQWDSVTVVPRWGFADVDGYYESQSVAARLHRLAVPALLLLGEGDPMVPLRSLQPSLSLPAPLLSVRVVAGGGHVAFPAGVDLGENAPSGWLPQVMGWVTATGDGRLRAAAGAR